MIRTRILRLGRILRDERGGFRLAQEAAIDFRFGGWCGGLLPPPPQRADAVRVQSTRYHVLRRLFRNPELAIRPDDVLVDVGCGKGRVINFWLHRGCRNRIIGIDLREDVARKTAARLSRFPNVSILAGDAIDCVPRDGTFFYLYNPFGADTLKAFIERLRTTNVAPARVRILYLNALHQQVFEADALWRLEPLFSGTLDSAALITIRP